MTEPINLQVSTTNEAGNKIDFILYKVQFKPFTFNPYNKWYKKLIRKLCGPKVAFWLFCRKGLTIRYKGKTLGSGLTPSEKIGRLSK